MISLTDTGATVTRSGSTVTANGSPGEWTVQGAAGSEQARTEDDPRAAILGWLRDVCGMPDHKAGVHDLMLGEVDAALAGP